MLTQKNRNVQLPSLMRFSTFIAQTSGKFAMSVISCLPAVSACSSRSPSSQLDVTAETTTKRSLPHDFAPSPSRARKKVVVFGKEIVFLVLSGKKFSPAAPGKLALRAAARSVVTNLGFHCGASSCAHFSDNDSVSADHPYAWRHGSYGCVWRFSSPV